MAQLTTEVARLFDANTDPQLQRIGVLNAVKVYKGSAVGLSTVSGRQLVAADSFLGFAEDSQDNSGGSAGDKVVTIRQRGTVKVPVTGATSSTAIGTAVYMSDGNTFTTASTGNSQVGKVVRWYTGTTCDVYFEGVGVRSI
jgi:hypothetical protein